VDQKRHEFASGDTEHRDPGHRVTTRFGDQNSLHKGVHVFNAPGWTSYFNRDVKRVIRATGSATIATIITKLRIAANMRKDGWGADEPKECS
jgi:hypothetical protein